MKSVLGVLLATFVTATAFAADPVVDAYKCDIKTGAGSIAIAIHQEPGTQKPSGATVKVTYSNKILGLIPHKTTQTEELRFAGSPFSTDHANYMNFDFRLPDGAPTSGGARIYGAGILISRTNPAKDSCVTFDEDFLELNCTKQSDATIDDGLSNAPESNGQGATVLKVCPSYQGR
jgi:hypothetical protein